MSAVRAERELVERDSEMTLLRDAVAAACEMQGSVVVVEAPAGQGKTALLRAFRSVAAGAGMRVLTAVGAELERDFPFGVVQQLFAAELRRDDPERHARLFAGTAELAREAFEIRAVSHDAADVSFGRLHGLYWLTANIADEQPLALVVDDAHWADAPSLRFLDVLGRRVEELPIIVVLAARPAEPGGDQDLLDSLVAGPTAQTLRPRALTLAGVAELLERTIGAPPEDAFVAAAAETTAGSPLLVAELLRTVAAEGMHGKAGEIAALRRALPTNVGRIVLGRLRRLAPDALAVARSVAVLGDRANMADVAELAAVPASAATAAHAILARVGLLDAEHLSFAHPIVREAVHADLMGADRVEWHRRAAGVRMRARADPMEVAAHLLVSDPVGAAWAAHALIAAGRRALADGAPDVAVRHLRRALAEPLSGAERQAALLSLGHAEARSGDPGAVEHLREAAAGSDPRLALDADRLRAQVLVLHGRAGEGLEVLRRAVGTQDDPDVRLELEDDLIDVLAHHVPLPSEYLRRLEAGAEEGRPTLLSHLAFVRAITGAPAAEVVGLARRALSERDAQGQGRFVHFYALEALMNVEAADEVAVSLREATAMAQRMGSRLVAGPLTYMPSAWATWERAFGDLRRAEAQAREALDIVVAARATGVVASLRGALAAVLLDRGRIDEADEQMAAIPAPERGPGLKESHAMRARLRLLQGRYEEALAELETEFELERQRGWAIGNRDPSRLTHVRVLLALGRHDEARRAAEADLVIAERRGVAGALARARLGHALTLEGVEALEQLQAAAEAAHASPVLRVRAEVLGELGAALRRGRDRVASREPLAEARELAHRCGATGLEERFHEELMVAGARPRRVALSGVESLTAAERRVAELAAEGMRNRDIAESLYVTVKTVELHLGHVYGKLDIKGRSQLAAALGAARQ